MVPVIQLLGIGMKSFTAGFNFKTNKCRNTMSQVIALLYMYVLNMEQCRFIYACCSESIFKETTGARRKGAGSKAYAIMRSVYRNPDLHIYTSMM